MSINRRDFVKLAAASIAAASAHSAEASPSIRVGVMGCGGRGAWIGHLFQEHGRAKVVALHDYFKDMTDAAGERLGVPPDARYNGIEGYRDLLANTALDAVAIISPPYFHPDHVIAALEAGKHVFLAKPIAVDVDGCMRILRAAAAVKGKLSIFVDFQTRNNPYYVEAVQRVRNGAIGDIVCGQVYYHTGRLGLKAKPGTETARLRNWVFDKALSGDIIVEQNVHVIDVANWILGAPPVEAFGTGGRRARTDVGDCWDHFIVTYRYPNDVLIDFSSTQFNYGFDDLCDRIFGTNGTVETHYGGDVFIRNKQGGWPGGNTGTIYQDGAIRNVKAFCEGVASGAILDNIQESADSTLSAILGRMAAYTGRKVTWEEMLASNEKLDPLLNLPENGPGTPREIPAG